MGQQGASTEGDGGRLGAVEDALRQTTAHVEALGELSAKLALSVEALVDEVGALAEQLKAEVSAAREEPSEPDTRSTDSDGARLVALNMALNGDSRETTSRYLRENFEIADHETLLDEVYAAIGEG